RPRGRRRKRRRDQPPGADRGHFRRDGRRWHRRRPAQADPQGQARPEGRDGRAQPRRRPQDTPRRRRRCDRHGRTVPGGVHRRRAVLTRLTPPPCQEPEEGSHTMSASVRVPTILRTYTDDVAEVTAKGNTLAEVIDDLETNHPGIRTRILDDDGKVRRFINVYVGDEDVRFEKGLQTEVADGAKISSIPAVAGGC